MNGEADWRQRGERARSNRIETSYIAMATKNKMTERWRGTAKPHADSEHTRESSCRSEGTSQIKGEHSGGVSDLHGGSSG